MSIENNIARIADALETLVAAVNTQTAVQPVVVEAPKPVVIPVVVEVAQPVAVQAAPVVASPSNVPFTDAKGLVAYMMDSYKTLGPIKGAQIQQILAGVGKSNINEVTPDLYATVYAGVEALKAGA